MKKYIITIIVSLLSFGMATAQKSIDHFQIQVDGLGCPFCAYGLEKKFKEFKGIKKVAIKIETGDFRFTYPSEKKLTMDMVVNQVKKAGYTPKSAKIVRENGKEEILEAIAEVKTIKKKNLIKENLLVQGNCTMCKARIETSALSTTGVQSAIWNMETKVLEVDFLKDETSLKNIAKAVSSEGHDSTEEIADIKTYENLPLCCAYRNTNTPKN